MDMIVDMGSGLDQGRMQNQIELVIKKSTERSVPGTDCGCSGNIGRSAERNIRGGSESSAGV